MARLKGTLDSYLEEKEKHGLIVHCSRETTMRIDERIADAFHSAQKEIYVRQTNSFHIMKMRDMKILK